MTDEERVTRLAGEVRGDIARLRRLATTERLAHQPDQLDAVKYRFVTAIEGCVSIAHHIAATRGWHAPESNADAVRTLGEHGVITSDLAAAMAKAAGFRNILVHQYAVVDDGAVVAFLDRLDALDDFVREVLVWMEQIGGSAAP